MLPDCAVVVAVAVAGVVTDGLWAVAELVSVPAWLTCTTICSVAVAPLASEPTLHVTVLLVFVQLEEAETNVVPAGRGSVMVTPEVAGPVLVTVSV